MGFAGCVWSRNIQFKMCRVRLKGGLKPIWPLQRFASPGDGRLLQSICPGPVGRGSDGPCSLSLWTYGLHGIDVRLEVIRQTDVVSTAVLLLASGSVVVEVTTAVLVIVPACVGLTTI